MNSITYCKYLLPAFALTLVYAFIWQYTLEDTWIFLAIAENPFQEGFLYGATSIFWGIITWVTGEVFGNYTLIVIKVLGCFFTVVSAFIVLKTGKKVTQLRLQDLVLFWSVFCVFPFFTWSVTGMDTALSMLWVACVVFLYVSFLTSGNKIYLYVVIVLSSFSYGVRPELGWLSLFLVAYSFLWKAISFKQMLMWAVVSNVGLVVSLFIYNYFTGSLFPSSSGKVTSIGLVSIVSAVWLIIQISPFLFISLFSVYIKKEVKVNSFLLVLLGLRLVEQVFIGAIDHRSFTAMFPVLLIMFVINLPVLHKYIHVFFKTASLLIIFVIGLLNYHNVFWYEERTENVHFVVQQEIEAIESVKSIGTEEVGLLAYRYGTKNIYDYHGLIKNELDNLQELDALIFTGNLMRNEVLDAGFFLFKEVCFEHEPTVYVRSVGFSPRKYCKSIYLPKSLIMDL